MRIAPSDDVTSLFYGIPLTALRHIVSITASHFPHIHVSTEAVYEPQTSCLVVRRANHSATATRLSHVRLIVCTSYILTRTTHSTTDLESPSEAISKETGPIHLVLNMWNEAARYRAILSTYYRLQRSWVKVIFSQASVILSTGWRAWQGACVVGGVHGRGVCVVGSRGGMCGRGACVTCTPSRADTTATAYGQ